MAASVAGSQYAEEAASAKYRRLRMFNLVAAAALLAEGALMLALSSDYSLPVTTQYLGNSRGLPFPVPVDRVVGRVSLGPMVALFLLLSGLALALIAGPFFDWYRRNLAKGVNYGRWIEYAITASLMIVVIAMLAGVYDLSSLVLIFFLNAMMILFGLMMELHNQTTDRTNWAAFAFGCIAARVPAPHCRGSEGAVPPRASGEPGRPGERLPALDDVEADAELELHPLVEAHIEAAVGGFTVAQHALPRKPGDLFR